MKLAILVACAVIGYLQAATPKPTHEPNEYSSLTFFYNKVTHNLILKEIGRTHIDCYVKTLDASHMHSVHTDHGLKMLELNMLGHTKTASQVSMNSLGESDTNWCMRGLNNRTITYYSM